MRKGKQFLDLKEGEGGSEASAKTTSRKRKAGEETSGSKPNGASASKKPKATENNENKGGKTGQTKKGKNKK